MTDAINSQNWSESPQNPAVILAQIERAKQEWEVTADALPQLICLIDRHGRILRVNRTVEKWQLGQVDEVRGNTLSQLLHPHAESAKSYLAKFWEEGWHKLEQGQTITTEAQDKWLGRYLEIQIQPITSQSTRKDRATDSFAVVIIQDVTAEREAQQRLHQQERLAALGQLAAGIAHYFNNILTTIIGFAELLHLSPESSTSTKKDLEHIIHQGHRAAHLTSQILDFSRQSICQKQTTDLATLLVETVELLHHTNPQGVRLNVEIDPNDYVIQADPSQLRQALINLTLNAWDAMPNGGQLNFRLHHLVLSSNQQANHPKLSFGDWIVLDVSDTGIGIKPENRSRIFEPFFTTKEIGEGTGLGLAQVYGILKQHGGEVSVQSKINEGTTFSIYLPTV